MSTAIGIDLGSLSSVIGVVQKGGVEIICNESSYRETSNSVGYGSAERLMGEMAKAKMKSNYKNTITFFTRFLNLDMSSPDLALERKHTFCKIVPGPGNRAAFSVIYQGENIVVTPEQALGAHFNKLASIIKFNNIDCREFVVTYPGYFSDQEKESMLIAARIGNVKIARLVSETECNVKNYGIFRRSDIGDTKRLVAFVDFGHSKTSFYIAEFTKEKANVVYENHNRHLGARDIDLFVYDLYQKKFEEETGNLVDENPKARMRLLEAIMRQRFVLSANDDANCHVEYLIEEEDFNYNLTRDQFESLAAPFFHRFQQFLVHCVNESKVNPKELHSVEILGGATRIPIIQRIIQETTQLETLSKTLNLSENCAKGACISAAEVSTFFKVAPYIVNIKNKFLVKCKYLVQKEEGLVEKTGTLFKYGVDIPVNMSVTMPKTRRSTIDVEYEDLVPHRSAREIFHIETQEVNPKHEDFKLIVRTCIDDNGMVGLRGVELEENYVEEQKKPKAGTPKDKKEGEPENPDDFEIVKVKKTHTSNVKFTVQRPRNIEESEISQWVKVESDMDKRDSVIVDTHRAKNDLESMLYNIKDKLSSEWVAYTNDEEGQNLHRKRDEVDQWIQTEGSSTTKQAYEGKIKELTSISDKITDRLRSHTQFADSVAFLYNKIVQYSQETEQIEKNTEKYGHLTAEDKRKYVNTIEQAVAYHAELSQHIAHANRKKDAPVHADTVYKYCNNFENELCAILNKKKPKEEPKKMDEEPTKTEGKEKMDVEFENKK